MRASRVVGIVAAAGALGAGVGSAKNANAQSLEWVQQSPGQCANWIAVGPNNVPWITGCGANPDNPVSYLKTSQQCGLLCFPVETWTEVPGVAANTVTVNLNGWPFPITSNGEIFRLQTAISGGVEVPAPFLDNWDEFSPSPDGAGGCVSSTAVPAYNSCPGELFDTLNCPSLPATLSSVYAVACGGYTASSGGSDTSIWQLPLQNSPGELWQQMAAAQQMAGVQMAFFTDSGPPVRQVLWLVTAEGTIWSYDSASDAFIQRPGLGWVLTDHFVVGTDGAVYQWDDSIQNWIGPVIGSTPNGIWTIAYSSAITNTYAGTIGPSQLWAVDVNGDIFFAEPKAVIPR